MCITAKKPSLLKQLHKKREKTLNFTSKNDIPIIGGLDFWTFFLFQILADWVFGLIFEPPIIRIITVVLASMVVLGFGIMIGIKFLGMVRGSRFVCLLFKSIPLR